MSDASDKYLLVKGRDSENTGIGRPTFRLIYEALESALLRSATGSSAAECVTESTIAETASPHKTSQGTSRFLLNSSQTPSHVSDKSQGRKTNFEPALSAFEGPSTGHHIWWDIYSNCGGSLLPHLFSQLSSTSPFLTCKVEHV